jgi:hypothetical protein
MNTRKPTHCNGWAFYQHMGVPLDAEYVDTTGRPIPIVYNGKPIAELF